jgi:hypothetical protein
LLAPALKQQDKGTVRKTHADRNIYKGDQGQNRTHRIVFIPLLEINMYRSSSICRFKLLWTLGVLDALH